MQNRTKQWRARRCGRSAILQVVRWLPVAQRAYTPRRRWSIRFIQPAIRFQLALFWSTTLRSRLRPRERLRVAGHA
jgi:hypothetical protein